MKEIRPGGASLAPALDLAMSINKHVRFLETKTQLKDEYPEITIGKKFTKMTLYDQLLSIFSFVWIDKKMTLRHWPNRWHIKWHPDVLV